MGPDPSGQPNSPGKGHLLDLGLELRSIDGGAVPNFNKAQHIRRTIQAPDCPNAPSHAFANGLDDARSRFVERNRFGEDGSHGMLGGQPALGSLSPGNISKIPYSPVVNAIIAFDRSAVAAENPAVLEI